MTARAEWLSPLIWIALTTAFFAAAAERAEANGSARHMRLYGLAEAPSGYVVFCQRFRKARLCTDAALPQRRVRLTSQRRQELVQVNQLVNTMVAPVSDKALYGRAEVWTYPNGKGDCEDYVLLKRRLLVGLGWPESALLIAVARDRRGQGHAVLNVHTVEGDFILDNQTDQVLIWSRTPYTFIKRQSSRNPTQWMSLVPSAAPQLIAASTLRAKQNGGVWRSR